MAESLAAQLGCFLAVKMVSSTAVTTGLPLVESTELHLVDSLADVMVV